MEQIFQTLLYFSLQAALRKALDDGRLRTPKNISEIVMINAYLKVSLLEEWPGSSLHWLLILPEIFLKFGNC